MNPDINKNREEEIKKGIVPTEVSTEMKKAYLDYAMSVIVSRAIPAVEDGLKPVQRRILYSMHQMGLKPNTQTKKSARIVGDVIGKFHPHGDSAVYDAMVRMAQDFSLRYPLVFGQGNFGCFTADTKVALVDGRNISFADLVKEQQQGKRNFAFTINNGKIKIAEIKNPRKTKENAEIMKIILDNGEEIKCTLNHKFMLRDGSYKEAKDLSFGDSLMPFYSRLSTKEDNSNLKLTKENYEKARKEVFETKSFTSWDLGIKKYFQDSKNLILLELNGNHKVVGVEFLNEFADVYDLTIDKTHNFALASGIFVHNSTDGDPPAAYRYTEAKLMQISSELLQDIDKETVNFTPNFDNSLKEPDLLPGKLPNLLLNGATGIAVGMATNIPPYNSGEVCDAITAFAKNPNITFEEIAEILQGPDFPTGGSVQGDMIEMYKTGRGRLMMRGKIGTETVKKKDAVVITEIPYMLNKSDLIEQIARLVHEKKLKDISDLRDESSKGKTRIVIELKKDVDPKFVINALYKYTRLQESFNVNFLALHNGQPKVMNIKEVLNAYIGYRKLIITSRSKFELKKAKERQEIVEGLLVALKDIDGVVSLIKKSKNASEASDSLISKYKLTKRQAQAILETKLQQLTSLEVDKLKKEAEELKNTISELEKILGDIQEIVKIILKEIKELKDKYGDERRTRVLKSIKEIKEKDLVQEKEVIVSITDKGYCKRMDIQAYKEQKRGGKGVIGSSLSTDDFVKQLITCSTHDYLMFFTTRGRVLWLKTYDIPVAERYGKGRAITNLLGLKDERVTNVISVKNFEDSLFMATKLGQVKRISLKYFSKPRASGIKAINLPTDDSDILIGVEVVKDKEEILLATKKGKAIRFDSDAVRQMGRSSYGVTGIKLDKGDEVVSLEVLGRGSILTITEKGYGKRTVIEDYRKTARAGKGVINMKKTEKTGDIVGTTSVKSTDSIIVTTSKGIVIRTSLKNIREMGRATQGVRIVKLGHGDKVSDIVRVVDETE